jgi:hypothetical protein
MPSIKGQEPMRIQVIDIVQPPGMGIPPAIERKK